MRSLPFDWTKKKLSEIEIFQAEPNVAAEKNCSGNRPSHLKQIKAQIHRPTAEHSGKWIQTPAASRYLLVNI